MAWTVIEHEELTGAVASWTSGTIPASYDHLCLMVSGRTDQAAVYSAQEVRFNGDSGANYRSENFYGWQASSFSTDHTVTSGIAYPMLTGSTPTAETFGAMTVWVPHYANTVNHKAALVQSTAPYESTGSGQVRFTGGRWEDTSAITTITVIPLSGDDLVQYSTFTLYGLTGA